MNKLRKSINNFRFLSKNLLLNKFNRKRIYSCKQIDFMKHFCNMRKILQKFQNRNTTFYKNVICLDVIIQVKINRFHKLLLIKLIKRHCILSKNFKENKNKCYCMISLLLLNRNLNQSRLKYCIENMRKKLQLKAKSKQKRRI